MHGTHGPTGQHTSSVTHVSRWWLVAVTTTRINVSLRMFGPSKRRSSVLARGGGGGGLCHWLLRSHGEAVREVSGLLPFVSWRHTQHACMAACMGACARLRRLQVDTQAGRQARCMHARQHRSQKHRRRPRRQQHRWPCRRPACMHGVHSRTACIHGWGMASAHSIGLTSNQCMERPLQQDAPFDTRRAAWWIMAVHTCACLIVGAPRQGLCLMNVGAKAWPPPPQH